MSINVTESITYSRKGKTFEAHMNGTRIAEADTRMEAEALLIEAIAPDLAGKIEYVRRRCGDASGKRAHRGAKLVLAGHVHQNGDGWIVDSETTEGVTYRVRYDPGDFISDWFCQCEDWHNAYSGQSWGAPVVESHGFMCKHCWAVKLSQGRNEKVQEQVVMTPAPVARSQTTTANGDGSTRKHGEVKPGSLHGKNYVGWCRHCQTYTDFGFGIGCLTCLERRGVTA